MKSKVVFPVWAVCMSLFLFVAELWAAPVDLREFTADPSTDVYVAVDGAWATIYEDDDSGVNPVSLHKDDFPIPAQAVSFSFDYQLVVPSGNKDYFDFYIGDASEPAYTSGGLGEFTVSGHFIYDLSGFADPTVPVIFHLMSDWDDQDFDSYVTISNVQVTCIPIPNALLLLGSGLLGLEALRRRFTNRHMER